MTAPATTLAPRRARLARYALWQTGDFGFNVAIVTLLIFGLLGGLGIMTVHTQEILSAAAHHPMPPGMLGRTQYASLLPMFAFVAPLIAVSGIFSGDRANGYTRFLFAKPVAPVRFYAQSLVIRVVGTLVIGYVLAAVWSLFEPPAPSWRLGVDLAAHVVLIGGMLVALSALTRYDGLIAVVVLLVSAVVRGQWGDASGWRHAVTYLVPPIDKLLDLHPWVIGALPGRAAAPPFPTTWFWWNVGYGVACMLLGFVLLTRRSLIKN